MGPLQVNWGYNVTITRVKAPVVHLFLAISRGPAFIPGFWAHLVDHPRFTQMLRKRRLAAWRWGSKSQDGALRNGNKCCGMHRSGCDGKEVLGSKVIGSVGEITLIYPMYKSRWNNHEITYLLFIYERPRTSKWMLLVFLGCGCFCWKLGAFDSGQDT